MTTKVDLLILGAGWSSTFLIPLCHSRGIAYAATTRSGKAGTIKFEFDPHSDNSQDYEVLPAATTVLITFPIKVKGASERLVRLYITSRGSQADGVQFIQLGTTSMWDATSSSATIERRVINQWYDRHSPFISNDRAVAEAELLALHPTIPTTVLNLSGLWGGERIVRNWIARVAPTKDILKTKGSIHMIHGIDVSRAILAVISQFPKASGQRWMLTDGRVYDWWDLASAWASDDETILEYEYTKNMIRGPQGTWVRELMEEENVRALPRCANALGRALDSREFWATFGLSPVKARLD